MHPDAEKRTEAFNALVRIAVLEAGIIAIVVAIWLATGNLAFLVGGLIGSQIVVAPMIIRWVREQAPALRGSQGPSP